MRLLHLITLSLITSVFAHKQEVSVYELGSGDVSDSEVSTINSKDTLVYLADRFDVADNFKLGNHAKELIKFIDSHKKTVDKPTMVVSINGVEQHGEFFKQAPSFKVKTSKHHGIHHMLFNKLPKQLVKKFDYELVELTPELSLLTREEEKEHKMIQHFQYYNEKVEGIWKMFTSSQEENGNDGSQQILSGFSDNSLLRLINDRFFITELSELLHFKNSVSSLFKNDVVFLDINSLVSVGKKIGFESKTYQVSNSVVSRILEDLSQDFDMIVFVSSSKSAPDAEKFSKRDSELKEIFKRVESGKKAGSCFTTEEACQVSTSNCNSHGVCTKLYKDCWSCLCSPTFDKKLQKTTKWSGYDCNKKNIAAEANLFLWTGLALLIFFVGGIKLLVSVGNEPLPGVLDAATMGKKNA